MRTAPLTFAIVVVLLGAMLLSVIPPSYVQAQTDDFVEDVSKRTRHSKSFNLTGDPTTFHLDASLSPLHFGSPGSFEDINNTIVSSTASVPDLGDADLEMVQDDFEWFALQTFNAIPLILFRNKTVSATFVSFLPEGLQWRNDLEDVSIIALPNQGVVGQVSNSSLLWVDAYGSGRNLTITLAPNRMIKGLVLDAAPPPPPQFIIDGGNPVMELEFIFSGPSGPNAFDLRVDGVIWDQSATRDTGQEVIFEKDGAPIFVFTVPFVIDALGNETQTNMTLTSRGPNLRVGIRVPLTFLDNATYPILIDPTVDLQVGAGADDTDTRNGVWSNTRTGPSCPGIDGGNRCDVSLRWPGVNVPQGATITAATLETYMVLQAQDGVGVETVIAAEDADNPSAPTSGADFANRKANVTTANTSWDDQDFDPEGFYVSPSIVSTIQAVISRGGWSSGNAIQIFWSDNGSGPGANVHYEQRMYNANPARAAQLHITFAVAACDAISRVTSDPSGILFFNSTVEPDGFPLTTEENVSASFQTGVTPALNVTNDSSDICDISIRLLTAPPSGVTLKFSTTSTPPNPGVNTVPTDPTNTTVCSSVSAGGLCQIWLWTDFSDAGPLSDVPRIVRTESF